MNTAFLQKRPQTSLAGFNLFIFDSSFNTFTLSDSCWTSPRDVSLNSAFKAYKYDK